MAGKSRLSSSTIRGAASTATIRPARPASSALSTVTDAVTGRIANATFGDYLVAVNADVPDLEVLFVGSPDCLTPAGTKGVGEVGLAGIPTAIANAVYHATGRRIRSLPSTLDQLL
jgi:xanthine dehydrogenase YagR molybdenum-binding subunit